MGIKVCMIGCGGFAQLCHGPAQLRLRDSNPDVELSACCDVDPQVSRKYSDAFGFERSYSDVREMLLAERPDAVVAAVPPAMTSAVGSLVLGLGFPLLVEKPPGLTTIELGQLISATEEGGASAQVAFNRRHMPVIKHAMTVLGSEFGPGSVVRLDYEMVRFNRWDSDFSTTTVHAIDASLVLARSPFRVAEISFQVQRSGDLEAANVTIDAECASGTRVQIKVLPVSATNSESATIHGVGQSIMLKIPMSPQSHGDGSVEHWRADSLVSSFSDKKFGPVDRLGVLGETGAFLEAVRSGTPFSPRLQDCLQQVTLMEAIRTRRRGTMNFERP